MFEVSHHSNTILPTSLISFYGLFGRFLFSVFGETNKLHPVIKLYYRRTVVSLKSFIFGGVLDFCFFLPKAFSALLLLF